MSNSCILIIITFFHFITTIPVRAHIRRIDRTSYWGTFYICRYTPSIRTSNRLFERTRRMSYFGTCFSTYTINTSFETCIWTLIYFFLTVIQTRLAFSILTKNRICEAFTSFKAFTFFIGLFTNWLVWVWTVWASRRLNFRTKMINKVVLF